MIFHANGNQNKARVAIFLSEKADFEMKIVTRDKEGNIHNDQRINPRRSYNNCKYLGTPQYIKQTLTNIKGEIDSNTIIVGDFNTPHYPIPTSVVALESNNLESQ